VVVVRLTSEEFGGAWPSAHAKIFAWVSQILFARDLTSSSITHQLNNHNHQKQTSTLDPIDSHIRESGI
jgi:hypothetical protein